MVTLEICCPTPASVIAAFDNGADRVELCSALALDGLTPSHGMIKQAVALRENARKVGRRFDVNVLIRPREGNFVYTQAEIEIMTDDIVHAHNLGADGVVVGALTAEGDIDEAALKQLMAAARGMSVTFHRAFDHGRNPQAMLQAIIAAGCDRLLTSGCQPAAEQGQDLLRELVLRSAGRIAIMAGAGVRPDNAASIIDATGVAEIHSSAQQDAATMLRLAQICHSQT